MILNPLSRPSLMAAISAVFLTLVNVNAQDQEVSLQFVSFPKAQKAERLELIGGGGKTMLVELPTNRLSPVYKVKRMANWVIGKSTVNAKKEPIFDIYGQTPALAAKTQLILVIRNGVNDVDGLKLIPFDSGKNSFGGGNYLFMNATKIHVGGTIGKVEFTLEPHSHKILAPQPTKETGSRKYLHTKLFSRRNNEAKPFYSSTWRFSDKARNIVFFYDESKNQQLRLHIIRDYLKK